MLQMEKNIEKFDAKKAREMDRSLGTLSASLDEKFASLSDDMGKRIIAAEGELTRFRVELEKTLARQNRHA
jgi:hypothetical protein